MDDATAAGLRTYIKAMRRYAIALVGNPAEADDLVQETLKRALSYVQDGRGIRDMRSYLFTILHNVRTDELSRVRRNGRAIPLEDIAHRLAIGGAQHGRLACRDLMRALDVVSIEQREVVLLVGLEGFSYQAAAEVLGVPIGTVMSRLNRGRRALRRLMEDGPGPRAVPRREPRMRVHAGGGSND